MSPHIVPHHFDSAEQAYQSSKLGLWLFLVTEILLFGALFTAYILFRGMYPDMFQEAATQLNKWLGGLNTVVLICSSVTMAFAVDKTKQNDSPAAQKYLLMTILFAACFMVIKYFEYSHKIHVGLLPAGLYHFEGLSHPKAPIFFSIYFMMTGLHGIHVLAGIFVLTWIWKRSKNGEFGSDYFTPVELGGIYWHLVDLIWIYLFPLLYLIG